MMDPIPGPTPSSPPPSNSISSSLYRGQVHLSSQAPKSFDFQTATTTTSSPPSMSNTLSSSATSRFASCLSIFTRCGQSARQFCSERMEDGCFLLMTIPFRLSRNEAAMPVAVFAHPFWLYFWVMEGAVSLHRGVDHFVSSCIVLGPVLICSILLHEMGHIAMLRYRTGSRAATPQKVVIWPFGGVHWATNDASLSPASTALVAVAGPMTHLPQGLLWLLLVLLVDLLTHNHIFHRGSGGSGWSGSGGLAVLVCEHSLWLQVHLLLANLLPAYPLDGSLLFFAALRACGKMSRAGNMKVTAFVGMLIGSVLFITAFLRLHFWGMAYLYVLFRCYRLWQEAVALSSAEMAEGAEGQDAATDYHLLPDSDV